jgi:hypothetical protein
LWHAAQSETFSRRRVFVHEGENAVIAVGPRPEEGGLAARAELDVVEAQVVGEDDVVGDSSFVVSMTTIWGFACGAQAGLAFAAATQGSSGRGHPICDERHPGS